MGARDLPLFRFWAVHQAWGFTKSITTTSLHEINKFATPDLARHRVGTNLAWEGGIWIWQCNSCKLYLWSPCPSLSLYVPITGCYPGSLCSQSKMKTEKPIFGQRNKRRLGVWMTLKLEVIVNGYWNREQLWLVMAYCRGVINTYCLSYHECQWISTALSIVGCGNASSEAL